MMESMLRNPEMQKMLYPYLPEPMRNPASIEWMLGNPEVKKQMEQMFAQQVRGAPRRAAAKGVSHVGIACSAKTRCTASSGRVIPGTRVALTRAARGSSGKRGGLPGGYQVAYALWHMFA